MIRIRKATTQWAVELCLQLERKMFPDDEPYENSQDTAWWLVFEDEEVVGFCALTRVTNEPGVWFLARSGLLPRARGRGLQRRMIKVREQHAKRMGARKLITYTHPENVASANNIVRSGYKLFVPEYQWGCDGAIYFEKDIT